MSDLDTMFTAKSRKGFRTRRSLIEAAFDLIADHGITHLTIAAVSEAVGLSRSSAYNHFQDLDSVLDGVLEHALDRIGDLSNRQNVSKSKDSGVTERRFLFVLQLSKKQPRLARVVSELYHQHDAAVEMIEARLLADIRRDIESGDLRISDRDAVYFARIAVSCVMASLRQRIMFPNRHDKNSTIVELLFSAIRA